MPEHAHALARHEKTWSLFERPAQTGHGANLVHEVRRRVARRRRRRTGAALAAAAVLMATGFVWRRSSPSVAPLASSFAPTAAVSLPETRILPDGTKVELRPDADFVVEFTRAVRRVALRKGEAHFDVTKDPDRPFVVAVSGMEVRAVGTAFAVGLDQTAVTVLVTEGRVKVDRPAGPAGATVPSGAPPPAEALPLTLGSVDAGNRLVVGFSSASAAPTIGPISSREMAERLAWRAPRLEFTGARLADAVALFNRYNAVQLVIDDPSIADLEVSGFFRSDNLATFLHLLEQGLGVASEARGDIVGLRKSDQPR
ncbi:MAG: FecR domain-containing protein [Opitutaceae bacterium]|nr:FecR domain-containing protein [Opitutaceae bacterium]